MKKNLVVSLNVYLIVFLPISLLIGNFATNLNIILINIFFLINIYQTKNFLFLKNRNFFFLIIIYFYLVANSLFIASNFESIIRSLGFVRYILLTYAIFYYFNSYRNRILKFWVIIYLIVSADILIEYYFGHNILGFKSNEPSRIASFTNDELIIGGYYFGFISICLLYLKNKNYMFFILCSILFFYISLIIGERSNFLKVFIIYFFYMILYLKVNVLKKFLFIALIFLSTVILINNNEIFKSKFYHMIIPNVSKVFEKDNSDKLNEIIKGNEYFTLYNTAFLIFKENLFFGVGNKNYRINSFEIKKLSNDGLYGASTHPHQIHFEFFSELGLIGYLLIMSNLIIVLLKNRNKTNDYLKISSSLFMIATLIPFLPSGSFFGTFNASIFWINYAFLINSNYKFDTKKVFN